MKLKIPNILTIGRIILVPIFILTFYLPGALGDWIPFFIFLLASFTDFLDGLLARLYKEESKLGELLDPIADKIIVASALVLLVMDDTIRNYEVIAAIINLKVETKVLFLLFNAVLNCAFIFSRNDMNYKNINLLYSSNFFKRKKIPSWRDKSFFLCCAKSCFIVKAFNSWVVFGSKNKFKPCIAR